MKRCVFTSAVALLACSVSVSPALAQAKTPAAAVAAAPTAPAAAAPAKWVPPVKGVATIEVLRGPAKVVGKEVVSSFKLKNTSTGSINLLKADQDWYSKERKLITSAAGMYRKPFLPGEVIDFELRAPLNGKPDVDQIMFSHANGKINAKVVKSFDAAPPAKAKK
ncbi:MAG: hypothetical protein ABIX28_25835 [Vicinamibacterales bacterium]